MFTVLFLLAIVERFFVNGQIAQTSAICTSDYYWMGNSRGLSPCQVASSLGSLCNSGNWVVPQLNGTLHYSNPDSSTASLCTCSWAVYNLISGCTACQGYPGVIPFWDDYSSKCTGKLSKTYWPASISTDTLIPYWASIDPTQWNTGAKFDPSEAQKKQQIGHADLSPTASALSKKSTFIASHVGAIVGVVIGGIAIFILITLVVWINRRRRPRPELVFLDESGTMATVMPLIFRETNATPVKQRVSNGERSVFIPRLTSVGREYGSPPPYMEPEPGRSRPAPKMRV